DAEAFSQRKRRLDLMVYRLGADLELEEAEALRALCMRFGDVLFGRGIAEKPHRRDRATHGATNEIDQRQAGRSAGKTEQGNLDRGVRAGIAEQGALELVAQDRTHPSILPDEQGTEV